MKVLKGYRYVQHNEIATILAGMDHDFLANNNILFAGGTLLTMLLGEYRRSDDIYFLVQPKTQGLKNLRVRVSESLAPLFTEPRDRFEFGAAQRTQYSILGSVRLIGSPPIKLEIFLEGRAGELHPGEYFQCMQVLALNRNDMVLQKLLANSDRYSAPYAHHMDLYDLAILASEGTTLLAEIERAEKAYTVRRELEQALRNVEDSRVRDKDFKALEIEPWAREKIIAGMNELRAPLDMEPLILDDTNKA
ncbi:nucleotidyl transferase AbiEii/AbiGii toxin family protein [Thalassospiraceae bacterium SW-3-3]|nr:nucleotidyl transferase AbiEii/AbiGii toxin family protein [Thalassospiraceae bacterium SW-3-3]